MGSNHWRALYTDQRAAALKEQQDDVFAYLFKWGGVGSGPSPFDFIYGAGHAMEIPFFQGYETSLFGFSFTEANKAGRVALQDAMMTYLANFCATGDPNSVGLPQWDTWSNTEGANKIMVLDSSFTELNSGMSSERLTLAGVAEDVDNAAKDLAEKYGDQGVTAEWAGGIIAVFQDD